MDHHIVQDSGRCQHETPVKREGAPGAAAAPAGFLIANCNTVIFAAGKWLEISRSFRKIFSGSLYISLFQSEALGLA